jgi:hypothetical protein
MMFITSGITIMMIIATTKTDAAHRNHPEPLSTPVAMTQQGCRSVSGQWNFRCFSGDALNQTHSAWSGLELR